ncbi:lysine-specific demethylase 8-like isoform X2 [Dermacentor silvarum]|uniref:lysine-specific demethylase 8-like isoform X2 n=1 Tax=Dermacentor silvarum TaxID=543639 RepID=UPI001899F92B|nr:lysine-specific demethylase 8-like isoform X2 [Dermacentor silvarum]
MVSLADKHLGLPVAFVADDFDDEEDPVMYLLKECVKFVNHPHACEDVTTLQENFESARAICDMSWEMLNIGDWKDVPPRWRRMYSYGSLLKALCELGQAKPTEDVLNTCDMGLIMGAPVMGNILTKLASRVHKELPELISPALLEKVECKEPHSITLKFPLSRLACPSVEHFMKTYLNAEKPVIITKGMDYWPALSTRPWSIRYLVTIAGGRTVPVELGSKYTDEDWSQKLMTLASFVRTYILKEKGPDVGVGYMAQHQLFHEIPELRNDICIPTYCCLSEKDEEPDINLWFGPEGTVSPLHHDPKNNILAQVFGEKYIRLYGKSQTPFLYAHEERLLENTSQVDVEDPDTEKFPLFEKAEYTECVLRPGEMLFIPPKCWHFVRSLSPSLSISFWWE